MKLNRWRKIPVGQKFLSAGFVADRNVRPTEYRSIRLLGLTVLLAGVAAVAGCQRNGNKQGDTKPPDVQVSKPVVASVVDFEEFTGQIEPQYTVQFQSRVDGYLTAVNFTEGEIVPKGKILFEIDRAPFVAKLDQAKGAMAQADAVLTTAKLNYERAEELWLKKEKAIAKEEFDTIKGLYEIAKANVKANQAMLESAQLDVGYCTIRAPFEGVMSKRNPFADPGNWVKSGSTVLSKIVSINPVYVYFNLDERTLLKMQRLVAKDEFKTVRDTADTVWIGLGDEEKESYPFDGKMDFLDNQLDPSTGTLLVRGIFDNSKQAKTKGMLYPGLFARIKLPIGKKHDAVLVSERAFGTNQGQKFVFVVKDVNGKPTAFSKDVKLGPLQNGLRVVEEGLTGDELIVVSGVGKVRDKSVVNPKNVAMPMLSSAPPNVSVSPALVPTAPSKKDAGH